VVRFEHGVKFKEDEEGERQSFQMLNQSQLRKKLRKSTHKVMNQIKTNSLFQNIKKENQSILKKYNLFKVLLEYLFISF
jgi:hypothetical protein